jgi:hypothetical protein
MLPGGDGSAVVGYDHIAHRLGSTSDPDQQTRFPACPVARLPDNDFEEKG